MRKVLLYLLFLVVASTVVFFLAYGLGSHSSLEKELARRTTLGQRDTRLTIDSLKAPEREEKEPEEEPPPPPEPERLAGDVTVMRYPLDEAGMVLLLDRELFPGSGQGQLMSGGFLRGLEDFFDRLPGGILVGLRAMGSESAGGCGSTARLRHPDHWRAAELRDAIRSAYVAGPRSIAQALRDGAEDVMGVAGERAVVVVVGGDEGCGGIPCQTVEDLQLIEAPVKVFVVVLRPPSFGDPYLAPPPAWQARMECLARKGQGEIYEARSAGELQGALLRIASSLRPNLVVRAFHSTGRELAGESLESERSWGAAVTLASDPLSREVERTLLPAVFSVPAGNLDLRLWYHGRERKVEGLAVGAGERIEVQVNYGAGELFVEVKDAAGDELAGDTGEFDCFWGAEVFEDDDLEKDYGVTCAFPAYFVLRPGSYTVRLWNGEAEEWLEKVVVKEGGTTVEATVMKE